MTRADLVRSALLVVAVLIGLQLLWSARLLVLTAFLGVLFGLAAGGAVDRIRARIAIKRQIAAPIVVFGTVGLLVLVGLWMGPTLVEQSQELRTKLPESVTKVESWLAAKHPSLLNMIAPPDSTAPDSTAPEQGRLVGRLASYSGAITGVAFGVVQSAIAVVVSIVLIIILAVYIASDPDVYRRGMIALVPTARRARFDTLLTALGKALRTWFATQLIAMLVIGTVTTILLAIIGVRAAFPLGVIAGIFEFIPNIGPILSAVPAVLMGFADTPRVALIVIFVYWGIQFLENNLLIPYLMKEQLDLPPALTLLSQVVMGYTFGFLGLFVAIPMLATVVVTVRLFWLDDPEPALAHPLETDIAVAPHGLST